MKKRIWILCLAFSMLAGCAGGAERGAERNVPAESESVVGVDDRDAMAAGAESEDVVGVDGDRMETKQESDGNLEEDARQDDGQQSDEWGLTLSAKDVTGTGCTVVYEQHGGAPSGVELITGSSYRIDKKEQDGWVAVPYAEGVGSEIAWTGEAWVITLGESTEFEENWSYLYGELPSGTYRIVKDIMDFRDTGDYDEKEYAAEFLIP